MPPSVAPQSANAANARLSTGPKTPEGKARSSVNARTHGLTAKDVVIGPEDREEFDAMLADFQSDVAPQGVIQQTLFDELVSAAWNLRRIRRMETELSAGVASYLDLLDNEHTQTKLDRLARHKSRIERTFHRSLKELKALQTNQAVGAFLPSGVAETPLASTIEITKRTCAPGASWLFKSSPDPIAFEWTAPADPAHASQAT